jgi:hypothetical protein
MKKISFEKNFSSTSKAMKILNAYDNSEKSAQDAMKLIKDMEELFSEN